MKKIFAVSGGVDSVVMLHYFKDDPNVIVAHFNHGIRPNSEDDCLFVEKIACEYGKTFVSKKMELGPYCSEEKARELRYGFLRELAKDNSGVIYTAHHADDLIESAIINILRGTGWRGLAPLNSQDIVRPLLSWTKNDIYQYAAEHKLRFRLDQTNSDDRYLRNRIRARLVNTKKADKNMLLELSMRQRIIADEIDSICDALSTKIYPRSLFRGDDEIAIEFLRAVLLKEDISQTRPQLQRAVFAIRSFAPGKLFSLNRQKAIKIGKYNFNIISTD